MSCPHNAAVDDPALFRLWERGWPDGGGDVVRTGDWWVVREHRLARQVLADPVTFSAENALDAATTLRPAALRVLARHGFALPPTLANNATGTHPALRQIVAEAIGAQRVAAELDWLTGQTRRLVGAAMARLRAGEPVDLQAALARDLPLMLLLRLLELPWQSDLAAIHAMSASALELFWAPLSQVRQVEVSDTVGGWHAWLRRRASAGEGLAGQLHSHAAKENLDPDVALGALFFLLVAGHATTSQFLTLMMRRLLVCAVPGAGVAAAGVPAAGSAAAGSGPAGSPAAVVEECLRTDSPIVSWRRMTTRPVRLGSADIPAGATVVLDLDAAGRDESVFGLDAAQFRPDRDGASRHLSFGRGAHSCLGAGLARAEARVFLAEVLPLLTRVRLADEPSYPDNLSFRIPNSLVVIRC